MYLETVENLEVIKLGLTSIGPHERGCLRMKGEKVLCVERHFSNIIIEIINHAKEPLGTGQIMGMRSIAKMALVPLEVWN